MAAASTSREQNFWPGFVDALTNVVLVMVLVVVIFAISMLTGTLKLARLQIKTQVEAQVENQIKTADARVKEAEARMQVADERLSKSLAEVESERRRAEKLEQQLKQLTVSLRTPPAQAVRAGGQPATPRRSPAELPPVTISGASPSILVSYAAGVTTLEKKLLEAFDGAVAGYEGAGAWQVRMQARMAEDSPSEARRLAFYRLAVLRDHLVARGVDPARIETVILDSPSTMGRSQVSVELRKLP